MVDDYLIVEELAEALNDYLMSPHAYPLREGHNDGFCLRCADMYLAGCVALNKYSDAKKAAHDRATAANLAHGGHFATTWPKKIDG